MRVLTIEEMGFVSGAGDECSSGGGETGNNVGGVSNFEQVGQDMIDAYEGAVAAMSHIIERVAEAL